MEKLIRGSIYIDIFHTIFGVAGAIYYYAQGRYAAGSVLALIGIVYLIKILDPFFRKQKSNFQETQG
ncbi:MULTISPECIES: hypothetical protein [Zobellia]|uniref:hypothetical protein n=1 Tax=Zobellia TaxID=112040 RepID=UPI001BFEEE60|nr:MULTISPECIES: hypothetical protein [Zobellia]MBT9188802.1 hypothetical protein [Zobellia russellii]MBU2975672.1 hypothetical protein [Zobellia sp. B3R18]MDO6819486.1 hypothetical protein [Zobellia sp. 1_MG-2023]